MGTAVPHSARGQPVYEILRLMGAPKCANGRMANRPTWYRPVGLCARGSPVLFGSNGHMIIQRGSTSMGMLVVSWGSESLRCMVATANIVPVVISYSASSEQTSQADIRSKQKATVEPQHSTCGKQNAWRTKKRRS